LSRNSPSPTRFFLLKWHSDFPEDEEEDEDDDEEEEEEEEC